MLTGASRRVCEERRIWLDKFTGGHGPRWSPASNEAYGTRRQGAPGSSLPAKLPRAQLLERLAAHTESCASCSQVRCCVRFLSQRMHTLFSPPPCTSFSPVLPSLPV
eukprot:1789181-Rhodomonas_salina.1